MSPVLFCAAHPDDETLAMSVTIAQHAAQDVHVLWLTSGTGSSVLGKLNATSGTPNAWWGPMHNPTAEGYTELTAEEFGQARIAEATVAVRCLTSGYAGTLTLHEAGLTDGSVTEADAYAEIVKVCDEIAPDAVVRLKGHTWVPQLDNHPDHIAVGAAIKQLSADDPTRFSDRRHYILPAYWEDPDLSLVSEVWESPNADQTKHVVNACRSFGAWHPPHSYAIGYHSVSGFFNTLIATPKSLRHS